MFNSLVKVEASVTTAAGIKKETEECDATLGVYSQQLADAVLVSGDEMHVGSWTPVIKSKQGECQ